MFIRIHPEADHRGFSLVEVVLALGVIGFSMVAILGVFPAGFDSNRRSIADTRAAQLAGAVSATIDAQCENFSTVTCYGLALDLAALSTADTKLLYVIYPSPDQPQITSTDPGGAIYKVELKFDNDPPLNSSNTRLGPGKLNRIQIRVLPNDRAGFTEYFFVARNRS